VKEEKRKRRKKKAKREEKGKKGGGLGVRMKEEKLMIIRYLKKG